MLLLVRQFNVIMALGLIVATIYTCWKGATLSYHLHTSPPEIKPSIVHYTYPGQNLVFDRRSYENDLRAYVVCDRQPRVVVDERRRYLDCEVNLDDRKGQRYQCPIMLRINRRSTGYVTPGTMKVRLLGKNKTILSWYDYSMPMSAANRWRLFVVHLEDCLVQEAAAEQLSQLRPYGFVVYDETRFAAIVISDNPASKCYVGPMQINQVTICRLGFDADRLQNADGPYLWFEQSQRDNAMTVAPLVDGDPTSDHLVVEHFIDPASGFLIAGVSLVVGNRHDKNPATLARYRLLDSFEYRRGADPTERLAYSTRNGFLSICAKVLRGDDDPPSVRYWLTCAQWDRRGRLRYEHKFQPKYPHLNEIAVLNVADTDGDMLVLTAQCDEATCLRAENRMIWLTRMTRRGLRILTGWLDKYGCDGRTYRADLQVFQREEDGLYCVSQVCYQDFWANPNKNRTSEFAFETKCFGLGNQWRKIPPIVNGSHGNNVYTFS
ncbi:uncharacterized protein LOC106648076 [Trichogramma pretiosum]|uniref:uncharacterized protein LOC106648076 n=1 Tax=Trichogramma pretiosum TaxID=7493 RepID=UPI0006C9D7B6|nr:uncharacterized protein LOC106648076 [Trichogramma pretiosum]